ncbi:MAG TPA: hypothetical protein VM008_02165 [Phycisphaerae bacterium]|nr:hypothetical protein [Phycisphaerae bacterium]
MVHRPRVLMVVGVLLLVVVQGLHFAHVLGVGGGSVLERIEEFIRANVTPLAWCAYLVFLAGLLSFLDGVSYLGRYRNRLATCWLWSVPAWCYFDWMNFYYMRDPVTGLRAWEYVNLPEDFVARLVGYLVAFGAIAPGMFLTAEVLQRMGMWRVGKHKTQNAKHKTQNWVLPVCVFVLGLVLAPIPIVVGGPSSNLAIWVGTWALLDPINLMMGRPSILGDWLELRFGRFLSLFAAGLICGFLWEFWNYWSFTKWIYHLPFLGRLEGYRYFEMPVLGLIGFPAFALETWAMWQTTLLVLSWFVEGEGEGDRTVKVHACV